MRAFKKISLMKILTSGITESLFFLGGPKGGGADIHLGEALNDASFLVLFNKTALGRIQLF